ncbi:MAG: tetratricopeptide repeat protein [Lachnospiraceae bacterium]|nr:tetratricopeptide repeat protein [Lachnospiraceae bacterium]
MPMFIIGAGGQGKTVLMMELAKYFYEQGYPVFWVSIGSKALSEDSIQEFMELLNRVSAVYGKKTLLMLDNPYADLDYMEKIYQTVNYETYPIQVISAERTNRLDYLFSDDTCRFSMWSEEGHFLCLGKQCEFESFDWIRHSDIVPFHSEWRHNIIKNIFSKLEESQKAETSIIEHIFKEQKKMFDNNSISLVETIYLFIFQYNKRTEYMSNIRVLSKRLPLDWDEWEHWLCVRKIKDMASYAYMAALYLLKIPISVETLSRILNIPGRQLEFELDDSLRNGFYEPVIYNVVDKTVCIKHDMIAELYFKFHPKVSVQNIYINLLKLMNKEELLKFSKKLFRKKIILGKAKLAFDVDIDQMIYQYINNQKIRKLLEENGELPWFELVRVWNKQINPNSKDHPYSLDDLSEKYKEHKMVLLETAMYWKCVGNRLEKVEELLKRILNTDSTNLPALNELARFYAASGRQEEAEEMFKRALEVDSRHLPVLNELARFYAASGRQEEAEETFLHVLEIQENNLPALNELGRLYKKEKKDQEALQIFEKIISIYHDDIIALYEAARLNKKLKHINVAIEYYNKILEKSGSDSKAIVGLFYCYYDDEGDLLKAGEVLKKYSNVQNDEYYLRCCAKLCKKLKRTEDIKQIEKRLKKIGSNYVI